LNLLAQLGKDGMKDGMTVHGMRSTFSTWAAEQTNVAREIVEAALAHQTGNAVERAYRRTDALEKRRDLMAAWAAYCTVPVAADNVVPIRAAG
jgi:integrase